MRRTWLFVPGADPAAHEAAAASGADVIILELEDFTPPMTKPVRLRTKSASALPMGSPTSTERRATLTRFAPEDITRTAPSLVCARNTSELAIWPTSQPR